MANDLLCTFDEFKKRCKFAIDQHRTGNLSEDEHDNMVKMLNLSYLNISDWDAPSVEVQASILLQITHRELGLVPTKPVNV